MRVIVEADGGSRGNPGPAGCGAVVLDADTRAVLAERALGLGETTNNVAEYQGLIAGLRAAHELGATDVSVRMDSKLVIEQMAGRWRVKHANLQPLHAVARELAADFERVDYEWIPRAENSAADQLANDAMDGRTVDSHPPADDPDPVSEAEGAAARTSPAGWQDLRGAPVRMLLLRHGQTAMSVDRRYSGRGDVELTELGERQVHAAAKRLAAMDGVVTDDGPAPIITSPLTRARQSAQAVADATGGELELHDGLLETDFGEWEGLTFLEAAERYPDVHRKWIGDPTVVPPGGESLAAVHERVAAARDDLVERHAGGTIVVVSHVTPIKSLLRIGLGVGPEVFYRMHLDLASLSIVEFYPDGNASVRLVNDISHWA
ncbi:bifunctional RNase H/acid phosphatase [Saccharopolyspora rhizosphaerae]|uniref:Bifunctional RNase H/acid phosphatase n=1 Tax=Saccharopolyspora rhizosphaerae TaxID=2492662 RepID=A0A426K1L7_9PSEU|nr:bifunctional RNase H/acid phosphatase [Saccharopolyspora rhizosphaerae]RRO19204.1 bifunctional RNase H/acid phosphatase [Saccharopolyspora rhizosphaerae]